MEFTDKGTFTQKLDEAVFKNSVDSLKTNLKKAFVAYMEEVLTQEAKASGLKYADLLKYYKASGTEELIKVLMGMSADEFINSFLDPLLSSLADDVENGTFTVENGKISLNVGTASEQGSFDLSKTELTLTGEGLSEEEKVMYPVVLTKK